MTSRLYVLLFCTFCLLAPRVKAKLATNQRNLVQHISLAHTTLLQGERYKYQQHSDVTSKQVRAEHDTKGMLQLYAQKVGALGYVGLG